MTDYQHLGLAHPEVVSAAVAFDAWWEKYQPVAYLTETILTEVPAGVDPDTIWTEFDGEYDESFVAGLHNSGRDDVSGYWFTSLPCAEQDRRLTMVTEVRQYCENRDQNVTCLDCPIATGLCSGSGNQWCEIPNIRYPGGAPVYSPEELLEMLGKVSGGEAVTMKNRGKIAYESGDVANARRWWEQAAAAGNTDAMSNLGVLAQNENDPAHAHEWFEKAANAGNTVAMFNLGNIAYGDKDLEEAQRWWELAADSGHMGAMKNLRALTSEEDHEKASNDPPDADSQLTKIRDETAKILKQLDDEVG